MPENTSHTTMSQSPAPMAPNTRQKAATSTTKKTSRELEDADRLNTAVKSKQQTLAYLTDYIIPDKPVDLHILAHILLQFGITNKRPILVADGIRAARVLRHWKKTYRVDFVAKASLAGLTNYVIRHNS